MALKEFCLSYVEVQHSLLIQVLVLLTHQALKWYHKTLQFIPESMSSLTELEGIQPNSFVAAPVTWQKDVRTYVRKHPRPGEEHLIKLDTDAPVHLDVQTKSDAKTLAQRQVRTVFICVWTNEGVIRSAHSSPKTRTHRTHESHVFDLYFQIHFIFVLPSKVYPAIKS